ncbi:MAG: hypothetical protein Ct9H300mP27_02260 [Chloroflexota bacterium]|nr:MAG: hypothetical protein Ct9H300mP27_02260 [Chloroflexota bacterium]
MYWIPYYPICRNAGLSCDIRGNSSEQSARMVAMRSATDNANALGQDLTLVMNKIRQDSITNELLDLIGGVIALEG